MDEDFDLGGFDEAYDISDFGEDQAFSTADMAPVTTTFGGGNFVDVGLGDNDDSLSSIINPALGSGNRTNITNVGGGSNLVYDPAFAAAIDIRRGIDPTLNLGGTGGVMVPAALRPQIPGEFMTTPLGEADMVRPMFNSQLERILQQTLPEIVRSGPIARLARGIGSIFKDGLDFAKDAAAGIKLPSLSTMFPDTGGDSEPTVNRTAKVEVEEEKEPQFFRGDVEGVPRFGTRTMDELQLIPDNMVVPPNFTYGITSVAPEKFFEANRNVADALQLIPSNLETNPISPVAKVQTSLLPSSIFNLLPTEEDREKRDFARDVFEAFPDQRARQFGPVDRFATINQDYFNRIRNQEPFVDSGNFIVVD